MVIGEILRYLAEHPEAKDTIDGILKWWFPKLGVERKKEDVERAINELVSKGWVVQRETTPSRTVYGLDKNKLEEISGYVERTKRDGHKNGR